MEKNENWIFIINPTAGNGYGNKITGTVREKISQYHIKGEVVLTERKGQAEELSGLYASKGYKYIIAVGGDGTLNEVARPLVHNREVVLGIVPAGTGNDFIQILGFPNRFEDEHWKAFFSGSTRAMDVGSCNGKIFLNGMGLGFDAEVAAQNYEEGGLVKKAGEDKYIWHIINTLLFFREKRVTINSNNKTQETDCFIHTIANGRRFAGSFFLTPKAVADDGLLDICMIKKLSLIRRFRILPMVPKGSHLNDKKVIYYQTDKITLDFAQEVPFHVDGELFFASKFEVDIMPLAIRVIYNPAGNHYFSKTLNPGA